MSQQSPSDSKPFLGKVVAVTGAASGIGLATCRLLYSRGASVAACDFNPTTLSEFSKEFANLPTSAGQSFHTKVVDVTQSSQVNQWIEDIVTTFGRLDHAANVAGKNETVCNLADKTDEIFDMAINLNLRGVFNCMRAQLKYLGKGSSIVNVSSGAGLIGGPGVSLYSAAKAGVQCLSAAAAKEYGPQGIRINCICAAAVLTPPSLVPEMYEQYIKPTIDMTPLQRGSTPEEQAKAIAFLLSEEASYISGAVLRTDGGFLAMGH